ncbi:MAG: phosphoribosyltransferase [Alphaproteobacteria bacterium]|nr:phosphoribosyltransferase [Alphaproteobacteria bacterium]
MTEAFWQRLEREPPPGPPHGDRYGARMPDGRYLIQPLRPLPADPGLAVASLISTQASFAVERALSGWLAELAQRFEPEVVVGLPTLGLVFARPVAERLGHSNWVAAGYSRKFWYDERLAEPVSSITSPGEAKRLWLDPRMLPRLQGRRVLVVDDVISTGTSMAAALRLLARAGVRPVAVCAAMLQSRRWFKALGDAPPVVGVFATPLFRREAGGWIPDPGTLADSTCALLHSGGSV